MVHSGSDINQITTWETYGTHNLPVAVSRWPSRGVANLVVQLTLSRWRRWGVLAVQHINRRIRSADGVVHLTRRAPYHRIVAGKTLSTTTRDKSVRIIRPPWERGNSSSKTCVTHKALHEELRQDSARLQVSVPLS